MHLLLFVLATVLPAFRSVRHDLRSAKQQFQPTVGSMAVYSEIHHAVFAFGGQGDVEATSRSMFLLELDDRRLFSAPSSVNMSKPQGYIGAQSDFQHILKPYPYVEGAWTAIYQAEQAKPGVRIGHCMVATGDM